MNSKISRILVIGVGGIGSFLIKEIDRLIFNDQISIDHVDFTICDFDIVEKKNVKYQNFTTQDVTKNKADVLGKRYGFNVLGKKIESETDLNGFDLIVLAVDNSKIRTIVYTYCYNNKIKFIDLRAEGRAVAFFTDLCKENDLIKTMDDSSSDVGGSCQLQFELDAGLIQNGNVIIASIGSQLILNWLRGETNPKEFVFRF